jgi:hypothetical protein
VLAAACLIALLSALWFACGTKTHSPAQGLPTVQTYRTRRRFWYLLLGVDGRVSTSKVQLALWVLAVAYALLVIAFHDPAYPPGSLDPRYLLILGVSAGAAAGAKVITTWQLKNGSSSKAITPDVKKKLADAVSEIVSNDQGQLDLGDAQYFLFNLVALTAFLIPFFHRPVSFPVLPDTLVGLTTVSAAAYVAMKATFAAAPAAPDGRMATLPNAFEVLDESGPASSASPVAGAHAAAKSSRQPAVMPAARHDLTIARIQHSGTGSEPGYRSRGAGVRWAITGGSAAIAGAVSGAAAAVAGVGTVVATEVAAGVFVVGAAALSLAVAGRGRRQRIPVLRNASDDEVWVQAVSEGPAGGRANGGGDSTGDGTGDEAARERQAWPARRRYLKGECPESIPVGEPFSLLVSIVLAGPASSGLKPFGVPPEGRDVLLVAHAPGLRLLGPHRLFARVPADRDSEPVMFELRADAPGPLPVSVTAWIGGSYLGELQVVVTAERGRPTGSHRDILAPMTTDSAEGDVSLVVRYDRAQNAYRFEFRDVDNPNEVTGNLAYDPGPRVEHLIAELEELAKGRSGYSAAQTRDYLENSGVELWRELVPKPLRDQFWDRQQRIRQLTILADKDTVPWELLYPLDPGHDAGFLVEQFPVTRGVFGQRPNPRLSLWPARFVLPAGSLPEARDEVDVMRQLLDPQQATDNVISALTPLQDLIEGGAFGLLHFACHNTYNPTDGSSITLDNLKFNPTHMNKVAINRALAHSAPTIFINACRSAGLAATYNRLDGWASKFLEAGAAAFIGSLWAVSDGAAREFAQEFYGRLKTGSSLGEAVMRARQTAASHPDDPTWLAYTVYGDPRATISPSTMKAP